MFGQKNWEPISPLATSLLGQSRAKLKKRKTRSTATKFDYGYNVLRIYLKAISGFYLKSRFLSTVVYVITNSSRIMAWAYS